MLSFFYRLLSRFKTQDEVTKDMQLTFDEARADARAGGWWSYSAFAIREIGGLFNLPNKKLWWVRTAAWGLAGLAAGWIASYFVLERYTSEASLSLRPAIVSQDLLPHDNVDVDSLLDRARPMVLSRNVLVTIVNNLDLYRHERKRRPMEDIVDEFRKSVRIERTGSNVIRVAFTYGDAPFEEADRILVHKAVQDLVGRLIAENLTQRSMMTTETTQFFRDEVDAAGKSWLKLSASVKATPPSDPRYELLVLERDQARREYESAAQKLGTAQTLQHMAARGQDMRLELLDAASLPEEPDSPYVILLVGLGSGLAAGLLNTLWRALRRSPAFGVPGTAAA